MYVLYGKKPQITLRWERVARTSCGSSRDKDRLNFECAESSFNQILYESDEDTEWSTSEEPSEVLSKSELLVDELYSLVSRDDDGDEEESLSEFVKNDCGASSYRVLVS